MNTIANIIVGMWFIPVVLFILVPLTLFAGNLLFTGIKHLTGKDQEAIKYNAVEDERAFG